MNLPSVRLTIDGMKHEILTYLNTHYKDLSAKIEVEVEKAVKDYNLEAEVEKAVDEAIKNTVGDVMRNLIGFELRAEINGLVKEKIVSRLKTK